METDKTPPEPDAKAWLDAEGITFASALAMGGHAFGKRVSDARAVGDGATGSAAIGAFQWIRDQIEDPNDQWIIDAEDAMGFNDDWEDDDLEITGPPDEDIWEGTE